MRIFSSRGFTLVELMIVIAILGILSASLFPAYAAYQQRGRDAGRLTDIDTLSKSMTLYYSEFENYPNYLVSGCVNYPALQNYGGYSIVDPINTHNNGCGDNGNYAYGMSTGLVSSPDEYSLLAIMEQGFGGNYVGGLEGFTGLLTESAFYSGTTLIQKGVGPIYVRIP